MPTDKENYQELWLKYYNIVVDILKAYNHITKDKILTAYFNFIEKVGEILNNNGLIDWWGLIMIDYDDIEFGYEEDEEWEYDCCEEFD